MSDKIDKLIREQERERSRFVAQVKQLEGHLKILVQKLKNTSSRFDRIEGQVQKLSCLNEVSENAGHRRTLLHLH